MKRESEISLHFAYNAEKKEVELFGTKYVPATSTRPARTKVFTSNLDTEVRQYEIVPFAFDDEAIETSKIGKGYEVISASDMSKAYIEANAKVWRLKKRFVLAGEERDFLSPLFPVLPERKYSAAELYTIESEWAKFFQSSRSHDENDKALKIVHSIAYSKWPSENRIIGREKAKASMLYHLLNLNAPDRRAMTATKFSAFLYLSLGHSESWYLDILHLLYRFDGDVYAV